MMRRLLPPVALFLALPAVLALVLVQPAPPAARASAAAEAAPAYAPDRLLVRLPAGIRPERGAERTWRTGDPALDGALAAQRVIEAAPLFPTQAGSGDPYGLACIYLLTLAPGGDVLGAAEALAAIEGMAWAEPDYLAHPADTTPDDPLFPQQWALAQIEAPAAWDVVTGTQAVVIAVVDSGLDFSHGDLAGQVWANPAEIPGNGLDDDNNGYVDDVSGWDFVDDDNDPADDNGHGTQVAGIAAAAADNGLGIAGACWECRVMPVKVMQAGGAANYSDIALGVLYAAQKGAEVINLSLGGYAYSSALHAAVQAAAGTYGAVVVAGAGNDNVATPFYPAAYPEVVAVSGTDQADAKASFSDYGEWVDLSAPAVAVTTTFSGGDWGAANGTSFAAPFVSGAAALVRSLEPGWSPALVRAQLAHTADPIDALNPGYEGLLGSGRVNAAAAVAQVPAPLLEIAATAVNGDPLGRPVPGESATVEVTLGNDWLDAAGVAGTLTTSDPYATVTQGTASFGDIAAGTTATGSPLFEFDVAPGAGYNHPIAFLLEVSANGGAYTASLPLTVTTRSAEEPVSGTIAEDTTWTSDKTWLVTGNVGVAPGVTLTIEAGTAVEFDGNYSLNVGGTLVADGTEAAPIVFRHHAGGTWNRIYFDDSSTDAQSDEEGNYLGGNVLRWVSVEGAASGIGCNGATPYLASVTSTGGGVDCVLGAEPLWLTASHLAGGLGVSRGYESPSRAGFWSIRADLPTPRWLLAVAAAGDGRIYAIGGNSAIYPWPALATVEAYDPATNGWSAGPSMPTARYGLAAALGPDGKIYAVGGRADGVGEVSTVEAYDPFDGLWATRASLSEARANLGCAAGSNGRIYCVGGHDSSLVEEYDVATDTWTQRAPMPTARMSLAVVAGADGLIYAIGGKDPQNQPFATVEAYDPGTDTWTPHADMPSARGGCAAALGVNGRIYVVGGGSNDTSVLEYDPATDAWVARAEMPTDRHSLGAALGTNGKIYAMGGALAGYPNEEYTLPFDGWAYHVSGTTVTGGDAALPGDSELLDSSVGGSVTVDGDGSVQRIISEGGITVGGHGAIADSQAGSTIGLASGAVRQCLSSAGGIIIGSGDVLSNTLVAGGIVAGDGSLVQGNDVEGAPGWAIQASGTVTVTHNRVVGSAAGIQMGGGIVQGNLVAGSAGSGLEINGDVAVTDNTLTGNAGSAVRVVGGTSVEITGNNLEFNTGAYDVEDLVPKAELPSIPAQDNWWGTTDPNAIKQRIYDFYDDYSIGTVVYDPPAAGPVQDAPAYVRSVTLTPESPVGIETVQFDVEFSRQMDASIDAELSFATANPLVWVSRTSMPTARDSLGVVAPGNGKIYAIGGLGQVGELRTVEEYDPATDAWATRADMPTPRRDLGIAAAANGRIYAVGGLGGTELATVEEYDPAADSWTTRASMPAARFGLGVAAARNGRVYAIGGSDPYGALATVEEYDPATNSWTPRAAMPTARFWLGVTAAGNGKIYAIGGHDYGNILAAVEEYDPETDTWATRSSLPTARYGLGATAAVNGKIYAVGGSSVGGELATVEEYDPATDMWTTRPNMLTARYGLGVAGWGGQVYAIGGRTDHGGLLDSVEEAAVPLEYPSFYGSQWIDATHFRAFYDINTLIPRDTYRLTIEGAFGADGIEIAPNSTTTFVVDWAGGIGDDTPPPPPVVEACAGSDAGTLSASWSAHDPDSEITLYRYAIGTAPEGTDVVNWTNTPDVSHEWSGLTLVVGQTYYVSVKARNEGGLWSEPASAGAVSGSGLCGSSVQRLFLPSVLRHY